MVGFDPDSPTALSTFDYSIAGGISGICTRALLQPLDVVKIRLQLQVEPIKRHAGKYHGIGQALRTIAREEGLFALWKGHVPAQYLSAIYGLAQFASYEALTRYTWQHFPHKWTQEFNPMINFVCGTLAGAFAMTASLPMDVVRTRLVAQGHPKAYKNFRSAVFQMYSKEGVLVFYRGFVPTILQNAPYSGFQFMFYSFFKRLWSRLFRSETAARGTVGGYESIILGSAAGLGAKLAVYPLDLLKKRLQMIGFEHARRLALLGRSPEYRGLFHCVKTVIREEGFRGLYKGVAPSLLKAAAASGCTFFVYEEACHILKWRHNSVSGDSTG